MKRILNKLRKNPDIYNKLKKIYGKTIGFWALKGVFLKYIGIYNGKKRLKLLSDSQGNHIISEKIKSNKPFMLTRYGSTEFRNLTNDHDFNLLCFYSGFFPNDERLLKKFREIYMDSSRFIDILVVWNYKNHFFKKLKLVKNFPNIENIISSGAVSIVNDKWVKELKNKKVLIIHPFEKTIKSQYKKRSKLGILPKLKSLQIIKAVQTIAEIQDKRFKTWFDALDFMKREIDKKDFDIAIIGCGAYGLPLAAYVKSIGKQALHLAGSVQLLFGIKGKRWENNKNIKFNQYWTHPLKEDTPKEHKKIEGGCYW